MCGQCYSYIYDFILSPLSTSHLLYGYINYKSLNKCSHEVADCISRALQEYVNNQALIDCFKLFGETYKANVEIMELYDKIVIPKECKEQRYDEYIWIKFKEVNQDKLSDLNHAIQICMDNMVVKKIKCKEEILEQFFMHKLRDLLYVLPDIHREHTEKKEYVNVKSLGSVPQHRINQIRRKAGLLVDEHVCISILEYDDLYN